MPRAETLLHRLELEEMTKHLTILVPEGVGSDRRVQFKFWGRTHDVVLPEGARPQQEVRVTLSKRPPLPRNAQAAAARSTAAAGIGQLDRCHVSEVLRHGPRVIREDQSALERYREAVRRAASGAHGAARAAAELRGQETGLAHPVYAQRRELYGLLRGSSMDPMLEFVEEELPEA